MLVVAAKAQDRGDRSLTVTNRWHRTWCALLARWSTRRNHAAALTPRDLKDLGLSRSDRLIMASDLLIQDSSRRQR